MSKEQQYAKELVEKYYVTAFEMSFGKEATLRLAKKQALIDIQNTIDELKDIQKTEHYTYERVNFYQEVKQIILNM